MEERASARAGVPQEDAACWANVGSSVYTPPTGSEISRRRGPVLRRLYEDREPHPLLPLFPVILWFNNLKERGRGVGGLGGLLSPNITADQ